MSESVFDEYTFRQDFPTLAAKARYYRRPTPCTECGHDMRRHGERGCLVRYEDGHRCSCNIEPAS
jgi:hypothetical protein